MSEYAGIRYEKPERAQDACVLLAEERNRARVLAGGTDLLIDVRAEGAGDIGMIVDIKGIEGIGELRWADSGELEIGACVTMHQLQADEAVRRAYPALAEGAESVGSLQVRHRATVGGNLCNASPCMDTAPPLLALGGKLRIAAPDGSTRDVELSDFFIGVKRTDLQPGEIATAIVVPAEARELDSAFDKIKRVNGHDLALVNAAATYHRERRVLRAAVGSCGITPIPTPDLTNFDPTRDVEEVGARLAALALEHVSPISDVRASAEYRNAMAALLCRRLVRRLLAPEGAEQSSTRSGAASAKKGA
jgi:carbon-monoxide dehydrogenase medium subunit